MFLRVATARDAPVNERENGAEGSTRKRRAKAARIAGGWRRSWKRVELPKDFPIWRSPLAVPFAAPVL